MRRPLFILILGLLIAAKIQAMPFLAYDDEANDEMESDQNAEVGEGNS